MINKKILVSEELFSKITATLKTIKVRSKDKEIVKEVSELLCKLENENKEDITTVTEKIKLKMNEMKSVDPAIHADLYILYRNVIDNRISEDEALRIFEMHNTNPSYNEYDSKEDYLW